MSQKDMPPYEHLKREQWIAFVQTLNPEIDPRAIRLMDQMRMVSHALYQIGESSLEATGLSYAQYRILMSLFFCEQVSGRGQLNPSEISERQGTSRNTVSALIRNLEEAGLVERHLDKEDRRKFNIRLTEAGRALVRENASRHMHIIGNCFGVLEAEEQKQLSQLLAKLGASIHKAGRTAQPETGA